MMSPYIAMIDWPVLTRQALLIIVPMLVSRGIVPAEFAGPVTDALTYLIGTVAIGYIVYVGQRREQPDQKIAETAALSDVAAIKVADPQLAVNVPSAKVTAQ